MKKNHCILENSKKVSHFKQMLLFIPPCEIQKLPVQLWDADTWEEGKSADYLNLGRWFLLEIVSNRLYNIISYMLLFSWKSHTRGHCSATNFIRKSP